MTGNPSGITNPISMTTTASTARSDMVQRFTSRSSATTPSATAPQGAQQSVTNKSANCKTSKKDSSWTSGITPASQAERPRIEPRFDSGFEGDSFAAVSKFFDSGNTQKMPPKRIEPATEKTRLQGFEPMTSDLTILLVNRCSHSGTLEKTSVLSEKQTIYKVHKHVRPHGWQRSACRSGGAALQKGSTVQKSWTHRLPVAYIWKKTHKTMNKIFKIIYGNSTKLISKLTIDGMPKLAADCQDPETFLSWYLDYRGWTAIQGVTMYIIGPLPPRPGTDPANPDLRTSWDAKVAEGLRYLCAALADNDLKANVACNATRADGVANGPTGYMFLKKSMLQGTAEGPAIQQVLDGLRYKIDNSIVSFQSRFAKFANALHPRPAEDILCQKYIMAVTGETGAIFDAEVTTTIAMDDQTDFDRFAGKLTKLISQKSTRMTSQKPTPVGQSAQVAGNCSTVASDHDLLLQLQKQVNELTKELKTRQGKTQNGTPGAGSKCDYKFPNGDVCGGNHPRKNCWYEDPSRCQNPDIRRSIERKVEEKSQSSKKEDGDDTDEDEDKANETSDNDKALCASHFEGEYSYCTKIVETLHFESSTVMAPKIGDNDDVKHGTSVKEIGGVGTLIIDTGVSNHIICDQRCIIHPEKHTPVDIIIKNGTGLTKATSQGPATFIIYDADGKEYKLTRNVLFCPEFKVNLFSPQREFKDYGTSILFNDVCRITFKDGTVVQFTDDDNLFKIPYMHPSESSGVLSTDVQNKPKTGFSSSWEHLIAPAIYHTFWEQLLLSQTASDKHNI